MTNRLQALFLLAPLCGIPLFAAGTPTHVQGVLIDKDCSYKAETRITPGGHLEGGMVDAYVHTKKCLLMPPCKASGYGVYTYDQKYLPFDAAGNQKALAFIEASKKDDDYRVEVVGEIDNGKMKVTSIQFLK